MKHLTLRRSFVLAAAVLAVGAAALAPARAQDPNACDTLFDSPDVIVGDLHNVQRYGAQGGKTSFAIGTTSCNLGSCWLNWFSNQNQHPVIGQNVYRLKDGRLEMIGMGWLKHGFFALSEDLCSDDCIPTNGDHLGVNCSDPYDAGLNGLQGGLGPKFQVNAFTGDYPYPFFAQNQTGDTLYKRVQLDHADLDPDDNPGARYFVEGMYVTPDDAAAGNGTNNASHREINILGDDGFFDMQLTGSTTQGRPAIFAWPINESGVLIRSAQVPDEGLFWAASKASDLGNGYWDYEYAVQNLNSHRSAQSFRIALPEGADVQNVGFHDIDYHSGETQEGTDWAVNLEQGSTEPNYIEWTTEDYATNPNANALRWGTMYNFRFQTDVPPENIDAVVGLWIPGTPDSISFTASGPQICDNDGVCELGEDCSNCAADCEGAGGECCGDDICDPTEDSCSCAADCGAPPAFEAVCGDGIDDDCDGGIDCADTDCCGVGGCGNGPDADSDTYGSCLDCDDSNGDVWETPGEVLNLTANLPQTTDFAWDPPTVPGGMMPDYRMARSGDYSDFVNGSICIPTGGTTAQEPDVPTPGQLWSYLVWAVNSCPDGKGDAGSGDAGDRDTRDCP